MAVPLQTTQFSEAEVRLLLGDSVIMNPGSLCLHSGGNFEQVRISSLQQLICECSSPACKEHSNTCIENAKVRAHDCHKFSSPCVEKSKIEDQCADPQH